MCVPNQRHTYRERPKSRYFAFGKKKATTAISSVAFKFCFIECISNHV